MSQRDVCKELKSYREKSLNLCPIKALCHYIDAECIMKVVCSFATNVKMGHLKRQYIAYFNTTRLL
ncbi:hypothetical protein B566_EDAN001146 [Ephemera danica]|nr:hypothetical protein B566_EDAN001146 [Ephemera danica]